jgi:2-oxoisovalerate dehydrogenase E1 component
MSKHEDVIPDFTPQVLELGSIPVFQYQKNLRQELGAGYTAVDALYHYELMLLVRHFENLIVEMKSGKFLPGSGFEFYGATHLSIGQEAVAVGAIGGIGAQDYITSTHRGHGHSIVKTALALRTKPQHELKALLKSFERWEFDGNDLQEKSLNLHLFRTMAELFGKEEGYCRGRGGGMHIADFDTAHLGANAIVGGSYAIATGAALASQMLERNKVTLCLMGDGATNNGICHEAYNFATMGQFTAGVPIIYLIENNQYGMTGKQAGEVTGVRYLAQRGAGYNACCMNAEVVNGMDLLATRDAVSRAADLCRAGRGPVLLECQTYRYLGHSLSDRRFPYRSASEEQAWKKKDALQTFASQLLENELVDENALQRMDSQTRLRIEKAAHLSAAATEPAPDTIYEGLYAGTVEKTVPAKHNKPVYEHKPRQYKRDGQGMILGRHAIAEALTEEMLRDSRVVLFGEDVAQHGGAFQVTHGLRKTFGSKRVFNTAISEACIAGSAVGMAMVGMRPVVEIMYIDFIYLAMDQIGNQAAKVRYMFGGKTTVPMVVRTTVGGGKGYAGQHSQSLEAVLTQVPGLKVVMPYTAYDTKGLLKAAIRDNDPVIFIEHQHLYTEKGKVPQEDYLVPIGQANILQPGKDVTVVAYSYTLKATLEAAQLAAEEGISVEVVDPRTLIPLDEDTIVTSVRKTGRLVCASQASATGCFAQHIAYRVQSRVFNVLKSPVEIVAAHDVPPPMARSLEMENLPNAAKILRGIKKVLAV